MLSQATKVQTAISRLTRVVAGHFCEAHERFGLDSEVVMLLQVSEGMRSPCVTILNKCPAAASFLEQEAGASARASRAQERSRVTS